MVIAAISLQVFARHKYCSTVKRAVVELEGEPGMFTPRDPKTMTSIMPNLSANAQLDIVTRLQRDDQGALKDILQLFGSLVIGKLRLALPSLREGDLEELLAEALYRVWKNRHSYDPAKGSFLNWFLHIARNAAIDTFKIGWRQAQALERPFSASGFDVADERMDEATQDLPEAYDDLMEILETLAELDRCIIHAYACARGNGHWTRPLVGELGMSAGAIRTRAHRILAKLRKEMQDRGYEVYDLSREVGQRDLWRDQ